MAENSNIEWTDHTFNPWIGCTKVSPGCANCYAENLMDTRMKQVNWGKGQPRKRTSEANWRKPLQWNKQAGESGKRPRVFCASLADWLDSEVPINWLVDLIDTIRLTPNLGWLLLTKRPQYFFSRLAEARTASNRLGAYGANIGQYIFNWVSLGLAPENVWIGTSVEDQRMADKRIPLLTAIPAKVRFLSCEPLIGPVDLAFTCFNGSDTFGTMPGINWVIAGGESGPNARPMHPDWARTLRDQCASVGVAFLFKQWGEYRNGYGTLVHCKWIDRNGTEYPMDTPESVELTPMAKLGKKKAGRELDGRYHNAFPVEGIKYERIS